MATVQVASVAGAPPLGDQAWVQVASVSASVPIAQPPAVATVQVARVSASALVVTALQARAGADALVESFTDAPLNGTASTGNITNSSWTQVSNGSPTVTLAGSGLTRSYAPPPRAIGYTLVFQLTVTDGSTNSSDQVSHTVYPWTEWVLQGSTWVAAPSYWYDES